MMNKTILITFIPKTLQNAILKCLGYILLLPSLVHAEIQRIIPVCAACHQTNGISSNPKWPIIAGQNKRYFIKQLQDMKQGITRNAPSMSALLAALNDNDISDLARYYAKMPTGKMLSHAPISTRGESLYRFGDYKKGIAACITCHGPKGNGNAEAGFPMLSGQHALYTTQQMMHFKSGLRSNDLGHIMQIICSRMSTEDMKAVAEYIEGLSND